MLALFPREWVGPRIFGYKFSSDSYFCRINQCLWVCIVLYCMLDTLDTLDIHARAHNFGVYSEKALFPSIFSINITLMRHRHTKKCPVWSVFCCLLADWLTGSIISSYHIHLWGKEARAARVMEVVVVEAVGWRS